MDKAGHALPKHLHEAWGARAIAASLLAARNTMVETIESLSSTPGGAWLWKKAAIANLKQLDEHIGRAVPYALCPHCRGKRSGACGQCKDTGLMPKRQYEEALKRLEGA